ncbi:MAG: DUF423 domain-containing protein [Chloroflexota bacterium]
MRLLGACAAIFGLLGVAAGAFGAHALKPVLPADMLDVFETGARYQMYHALAALGALGLAQHAHQTLLLWSVRLLLLGTLVFSGSLYTLAISGQRWFGAITPIGGVLFLAGWAALALALLRRHPAGGSEPAA